MKPLINYVIYTLLLLVCFNTGAFGQRTYTDSAAVRIEAMLKKIEATKDIPPGNFSSLSDSKRESASGSRGNASGVPSNYHWFVASNGSDNNPGSQSAPFRTIQKAINTASSGQSIKVADGWYAEKIDFSGKSIKLVGNPDSPASVVLSANGTGTAVRFGMGEDKQA